MNTQIDDQSFQGRVFDSYQNMRQIARCLDESSKQRGIEQPRFLELSRRPTGIQDYLPEADWLHYSTHHNDEPTLGDPVTLPFADKSVDACLISDVYEHIPASSRPGLLKEMLRVTDGLVLVACPNGNEVVSKLDKMVFDFIWGKYGERFTPLEQHAEFGVEPLEQVVANLKAQGADQVAVMPANYVYRWIHMILIYFDLQHRNPGGHYLFEPLNRIYNERLSPYDYREPCYRYLIAVSTNSEINVDKLTEMLTRIPRPVLSVAETDEMLVETFRQIDSTAADEIRRLHSSMGRMQQQLDKERRVSLDSGEEVVARNEEIQRTLQQLLSAETQLAAREKQLEEAEAELERMSGSLGWKLLSRYGTIKYRYLLGLYRLLGLSRYITNRRAGQD